MILASSWARERFMEATIDSVPLFFSIVVLAVVTFRSLIPTLRARTVVKTLFTNREQDSQAVSSTNSTVWIVLPLCRETRMLAQVSAVAWRLCNFHEVIVVLATSDRCDDTAEKDTTADSIKQLKWPERCRHIHLAAATVGKGALLNAVVSELRVPEQDWIGIYDADSEPDPRIVRFVLQQPAEIDVVQQPSVYAANFRKLSAEMQIQAAFQTVWSFGVEVPRLSSLSVGNWFRGRPMFRYAVGHGLFLRSSY